MTSTFVSKSMVRFLFIVVWFCFIWTSCCNAWVSVVIDNTCIGKKMSSSSMKNEASFVTRIGPGARARAGVGAITRIVELQTPTKSSSRHFTVAPLLSTTSSSSSFSTTTPTASEEEKDEDDDEAKAKASTNKETTITIEHNHCKVPGDRDILIRAARGEHTERTPVWLMRQAGRYMSSFRKYSDTIPFRVRSETPSIAIELSMQCHRTYGMDGIIMFSDILTPLPCLGVDFDVVSGTGPVIRTKIATEADVDSLPMHGFSEKVPFVKEILNELSMEAENANTALIGFVGAPFTLAAYTVEQKSSKHCSKIKKLLYEDQMGTTKTASKFLDKLATLIGNYGCYQIENGAQMIQVFESWAHQLSPDEFVTYAKPAAMKAIDIMKTNHPNVPVIYFANGGSSFLEKQKDMVHVNDNGQFSTENPNEPFKGPDMIAIDWHIDMKTARDILGPDVPISGNIDPSILLLGSKEQIEHAVRDCIDKAGGPGNKHVLNLGHGVMQGTPEINVKYLVDEVKRYHN